jgi:glucans biosynthesis protein C
MPIAFYAVYRVTAVDPSWSSFWAHWTALPITPTGPMWFLWFLIALDFCAAAIFKLASGGGGFVADLIEKITQQPRKLFAIVVCITALAYLPLSALHSPWYWAQIGPFEVQATFAPQYAIYFFVGLAIGAQGLDRGIFDEEGTLVRRWGYADRRQGDARAHRHGVRELGSKRLDRPCSDRLPSRVHARCGVARR